MGQDTLLCVQQLHTGFETSDGFVPAVTGVTFSIKEQESVALVGESGSGKSVTALSILRLLSVPPARIEAKEVAFAGIDLMKLDDRDMRRVRGNEISMIFQEPMTSLNPTLTVGFQISEVIQLHKGLSKDAARDHAIEMLRRVRIPDAEKRFGEYPHQMSGGMCQRVMIAIALACNPRLLIADEPTTALDVTIQAQILELIADLQEERKMATLLITHNLGIVAQVANRVMIMYAGQIVETVWTDRMFESPGHPYTEGLLGSIPSVDQKVKRLHVIRGVVTSPLFYGKACRFAPRCPYAKGLCSVEQPELREVEPDHWVRCHFPILRHGGEDLA